MRPVFTIGDAVRTRVMNPAGHTRLPVYLRGRRGRIEHVLGTLPFPDRRAEGAVDATEVAYTVRFAGSDVWGPDAEPEASICADLFESYLERA
jgi:nitrile hydratase